MSELEMLKSQIFWLGENLKNAEANLAAIVSLMKGMEYRVAPSAGTGTNGSSRASDAGASRE